MAFNPTSFNYTPLDHWYDEQISRYFKQFLRIFSGFQYETGKDRNGLRTLRRVPARYGAMSRMVGHILRNNSENILLSTPFITAHIGGIAMAPEMRQYPYFISKVQTFEREFDEETQTYTDQLGVRSTVERFMPVPYILTLQTDIWTTNTDQKLQLLEQIMVLFNPALEIQSSVNPLDWAALTYVEMQDITWSSQAIPIGTEDGIDVATFTFKVPIWINPPAKVKRQKLIEQIVLNIGEASSMEAEGLSLGFNINWSESDLLSRIIITPENAHVVVDGNEITLLTESTGYEPGEWIPLLDSYENDFRPGISQLRLKTTTNIEESESDIVGSLDFHPTDPTKLIWQVELETLPGNTLDPISALIDPLKTSPGIGLPAPANSQRYLILEDIGPSDGWPNLTAFKNDIIHFNGAEWEVVFEAATSQDIEFLLNNISGKQLRWNGEEWHLVPDGEYNEGFWRLFL